MYLCFLKLESKEQNQKNIASPCSHILFLSPIPHSWLSPSPQFPIPAPSPDPQFPTPAPPPVPSSHP